MCIYRNVENRRERWRDTRLLTFKAWLACRLSRTATSSSLRDCKVFQTVGGLTGPACLSSSAQIIQCAAINIAFMFILLEYPCNVNTPIVRTLSSFWKVLALQGLPLFMCTSSCVTIVAKLEWSNVEPVDAAQHNTMDTSTICPVGPAPHSALCVAYAARVAGCVNYLSGQFASLLGLHTRALYNFQLNYILLHLRHHGLTYRRHGKLCDCFSYVSMQILCKYFWNCIFKNCIIGRFSHDIIQLVAAILMHNYGMPICMHRVWSRSISWKW